MSSAYEVPGPRVTLAASYGPSVAQVLGLLRFAGSEGSSRSELATRTGLTPQAVSKITARLRADGLVTEAGRRASTGGKPSTVLRLAPGARHAVGLQLDRDRLTAVLVDLSGTLIAERTAPLDFGGGAETVLSAVESAVRGLLSAGLPGTGPSAADGEVRRAAEGEVWSGAGTGTGTGPDLGPGAGPGTGWGGAGTGGGAETGRQPDRGPAGGPADRGQGGAGEAAAVEGELWARALPGLSDADADAEAEAQTEADSEDPGSEIQDSEVLDDGSADREPGPRPLAGSWGRVLGVGVATPGPLDHERGVLLRVTGHEEWEGYPLRDALARRLGLPVVLDKDTNAAATGLALHGTGSFAYLHLGTGLGAGLVLEGRVHRGGGRQGAGEFGHQVLRLDGPLCRCGRRGCAEVLCLDAVRRGDSAEAARVLGVGAANLVSLLGIDRMVLGGRTVLTDPGTYVAGVSAAVAAEPRPQRGVGVDVAPAGPWTVADGAAQLVLAPLFGRSTGGVQAVR